MGIDDDGTGVLAMLPDGTQVLSTLLADQVGPRHVYRVVNSSGAIIQEFSTLIEVSDFVSRYAADLPAGQDD